MALVQFVLRKWVWFSSFCANGFGSVRSARMALVQFVLREWLWFSSFCRISTADRSKRLMNGVVHRWSIAFRLDFVFALCSTIESGALQIKSCGGAASRCAGPQDGEKLRRGRCGSLLNLRGILFGCGIRCSPIATHFLQT